MKDVISYAVLVLGVICLAFALYISLDASKTPDVQDDEQVYLTATSADGKYLANILWEMEPYYKLAEAFLVVNEVENDLQLLRVHLLSRDDFAEIEREIPGISWDRHTVVLELNRHHYRGPSRFEIVGPLF